jgi:DNA polymerase-3 subunit delta
MTNEVLIYFFYGEDNFRINKEIEKIKSGTLSESEYDFNFDKLIAPSPSEFLNIAESYPAFAEKRIVQAEDFDDSFLNDESILEYAKSPSSSTLVIFYYNEPKINENWKFFKELKNKNYFKLNKVRKLYDNEIPSYIKNLAKEKEISISEESAYYIMRYTGNNLLNIDSELDKLSSGINVDSKANTEITLEKIKSLVSFSKKFSVFDLTDKILDRDFRAAFSMFDVLCTDGEEPIKIISILYNDVKKLHRAKIQEKSGMNIETILNSNAVLPFLKGKFLKRISLFNTAELRKIVKLLEDADLKLKTTSYPPDLIFEDFIFKLNRL